LASNVTRVGDVSDVTSVNTVLQQCTGKVVRLNIQFEITYSTTVVGFNTTMLLVVLMERCNFVSAGIETEATGHFTYRQLVKGFRTYITEASVVVRKLDCKTYNWRFKTTEVMSKETYLLNIFLASQFVMKFQNDHLTALQVFSSGII